LPRASSAELGTDGANLGGGSWVTAANVTRF
jgi:hypothetical protein